MLVLSPEVERRLLEKIGNPDDNDCWPWLGTIAGKPTRRYGQFWDGRRRPMAHRVVYEYSVGFIPEGLQLDHLCRNTLCVNPDHLEPVTAHENQRRGYSPAGLNMAKTHCHRGHKFTEENTKIVGKRRGRRCAQCAKTDALLVYYRNREQILAARRARRRNGKKN